MIIFNHVATILIALLYTLPFALLVVGGNSDDDDSSSSFQLLSFYDEPYTHFVSKDIKC